MESSLKDSGGFWNTPKVVYSEATKSLLKNLMQEANVSNTYRQQINSQVKKGESLDQSLKNRPVRHKRNITKSNNARKMGRSFKPGIRPRHAIEASMKDDTPPYRPKPVPATSGPAEKTRLAYLMTYGEEPRAKPLDPRRNENGRFAYLKRRVHGVRKLGKNYDDNGDPLPGDDERFLELIREVKERRQFLDQMKVMGKEHIYKNEVETEISQLVREMEQIDMKRSAELEKAIELQETRGQQPH
ncbi:hypothetical protein CRM22_001253 [Opisthorchis felineus]|uniref:Uncharacterized protein n=1 Tax=Opisthorchis felineus TaxID=147828 RepID=A0A4S2MBF7_OPIFE|nr:hypothetical protein CRM22_001253 [Opisthorchis felineus]